jgi:hypothetical protein
VKRAASLLAAAVALGLALASPGAGSWSVPGTGTGAVAAKAMPPGSVPDVTVSSHDVTLTWAAGSFAGGGSVSAYVVTRYDAVTGIVQTTLAGCAGKVAALSCTEQSVPTGTWTYTITPASGDHWLGAEGAKSLPAVVLI